MKKMERLLKEAGRIRSGNKRYGEVFEQYIKHEHYLLRSAMEPEEEKSSRNAFVRAYGRELRTFQKEVEHAAEKIGLAGTGAEEEVYRELGIGEVMADYKNSLGAPEKGDPLYGLSEDQKNGIHDFHKWLYRNCDKSGFAYLGSAGSVREYADAFTKKPGKDQLRALYIVEHGLGEEENAVELANMALDTYTPDLDAIKDRMVKSKFRVFSRMDGTKFRWDRLSSAVDLVEEENIKSAEQENAIRDIPKPDMTNPEIDEKIQKIAEENHVPENQVKETVDSLGKMQKDLRKLHEITGKRPQENASEEEWKRYLLERNTQLETVRKSSGEVLKNIESGAWKEKIGEIKDGIVGGSDFILNLTYAYDVAAQSHTAAKAFKLNVQNEDELESVYSSIYQACGGGADDKLLTYSENAMDIGLGVLTAVSSGAAMIGHIDELLKNRGVVRKTENIKQTAQVTQDLAYTVGGISDTVGTVSSMFQTAKDLEETAKYAGSTAKAVSDTAGTVSGITGLVTGSTDMIMGGLDIGMGTSQRSRAVTAKTRAKELTDKEKKAEIRGAAKTVRRKNKWKIRQGILTFLRGAAGVAAGALAFTVGLPAVATVAAAVGAAVLAGQLFFTDHKERIGNNRKAIDANILAKERELSGQGNVDEKTGKKIRAIDALVEERKAKIRERMEKASTSPAQKEYLSKLLNDDKKLKHAIRTEAAVKMGCLTQEDCRQKLDMQNVERAFRHVYLKDPDGLFTDENIITIKDVEKYFGPEKMKEQVPEENVKEQKGDQREPGKAQEAEKEKKVERLAYRDLLKGLGFSVRHHSKADAKQVETNMEKAKNSMEK